MPPRKCPSDTELIRLYGLGMSAGEIAESLNLNTNTVSACLHRSGCKMRSTSEAQRLRFKRGRWNPARYWLGKKFPPEVVEARSAKIRGENHYLWKGGASRRPYRSLVVKEKCAKCGSRLNLGIHHIDYDHYNDNPDNLQVLCVSCHCSLHKKAYWDAYHAGLEYKPSNSPIGWHRKESTTSE